MFMRQSSATKNFSSGYEYTALAFLYILTMVGIAYMGTCEDIPETCCVRVFVVNKRQLIECLQM